MINIQKALVLRARDINENDKIVTLITTSGIVNCNFKGVKKQNAHLKTAILPFSYGEYSIESKGNIVVGFKSITVYNSLTLDYDAFVLASIACECTCNSTIDSDTSCIFVGILTTINNMSITLAKHNNSSHDCYTQLSNILYEFLVFILCATGYKKDYSKYELKSLLLEFENIFETNLKSKSLLKN